ncbi:MAG: GAF domain-containing protein [Saprospiraceae bacterium]
MVDNKEIERIQDLRKYEILDTPPDGYYDELTSLASKIFDVPISIVSLVDVDRIWFKSSFGLDVEQVPRNPGLCSSAIMSDEVYIVENAKTDPRTMTNPLVAGAMGFDFYAAAPLKSKNGYNLGTFCIIDKWPRRLTAKESSILLQLSRIVMDHFELKLQSRLLVKALHSKNSGN